MKKIITMLLILLNTSLFAQNNELRKFSLKEAIQYAQEHNYSALNAKKDIDKAIQKRRETIAMGLPQVNGSVSYQNNIDIQKSVIPGEFVGGEPGTFAEVAFGTTHVGAASATISQLIFNGSYLVGLESSKLYLKLFNDVNEKTKTEIKNLTISSYGNVLISRESVDILEKNKKVLEKILADTKKIYKNGLIEEENVEQLQVTLNSLNTSINELSSNKQLAEDLMKVILGIPITDSIELTDKLEGLTIENISYSSPELDLNKNIDFIIQQNDLESKRLLLKLEKSKALPTLAAQYNYGANAFNDTFKMLSTDQKWLQYSNVGLALNVPIFSGFERSARTAQAKIEHEQSKIKLTEKEQTLQLEFKRAKTEYDFSIKKYNNAKENLRLAERIEIKQEVKFKEGLSSSFDFADAQKQLYTAQQEYLQSMADIINKKATLEKVTGN
jgi:outer membrane protein